MRAWCVLYFLLLSGCLSAALNCASGAHAVRPGIIKEQQVEQFIRDVVEPMEDKATADKIKAQLRSDVSDYKAQETALINTEARAEKAEEIAAENEADADKYTWLKWAFYAAAGWFILRRVPIVKNWLPFPSS